MNNIFILLMFLPSFLLAQKRDNNWILGYSAGDFPDTTLEFTNGIVNLSFTNNILTQKLEYNARISIDSNTASISDSTGNLLFFFNGNNLYNSKLELAKGENNINVDSITYLDNGVAPQHAIFLPYPGDESKSVLFYKNFGLFKKDKKLYVHDKELNVAILKNKGDDGLGEVLIRKINLIKDTLDLGKLTAIKHANGRDWWLIAQRFYDNTYYKILLSDKEIKINDKQTIGKTKSSFYGQGVFSPDGTKYIVFETFVGEKEDPHVIIYDFDRCTGNLSNPKYLFFPFNTTSGGCAVSPNSRFLYLSFGTVLFQFDLQAADLAKSQKNIAYYDNIVFLNTYPIGFDLCQLAPDGKIYISTSGTTPYLHVINKPDLEGLSCDFARRAIKLPVVNSWCIPNHPNYRLGALKGSPCDTLGLGVTTKDIEKEEIKIFPNPASESITIQCEKNTDYQLIIRNITSQVLKQESILNGNATIDTSDLQNGMIICELWAENQRVATEKIIIIH